MLWMKQEPLFSKPVVDADLSQNMIWEEWCSLFCPGEMDWMVPVVPFNFVTEIRKRSNRHKTALDLNPAAVMPGHEKQASCPKPGDNSACSISCTLLLIASDKHYHTSGCFLSLFPIYKLVKLSYLCTIHIWMQTDTLLHSVTSRNAALYQF